MWNLMSWCDVWCVVLYHVLCMLQQLWVAELQTTPERGG